MAGPAIIRLLSPEVANQIAAGEVIERPASVVKELLENSLDAGADSIDVEIEQGGVKLIRIRDNGCGIRRDDLELAFSRHATSKISSLRDLHGVNTLGFRGEALASIASIARVSLCSKFYTESAGYCLRSEGRAAPSSPDPAAHPAGSTVEVRDLFFNTPARRKFLKTEKTEFSHLFEAVKRIGLSRFDVSIRLRNNDKLTLSMRAAETEQERLQRVSRVCGPAFPEHAVSITNQASGLGLSGWITLPVFSRSQADMQYFFVNGRIIRDKLISHAIRQAYQDVLYQGRHPVYVLYLSIEPDQMDVNVHPAKHEVRFVQGRWVHDFLFSSIHKQIARISPDSRGKAGSAKGGFSPKSPAESAKSGFPPQ
ncbi:MAG: DNA mismatch repair endonuclease MutL, partial [Gammaproteobacteria bacterium]|nr:DNA mismatch repair endonuclease MutL [Gammaproteobacteria bacterium]